MRYIRMLLWRSLALGSLLLGLVGVLLPGLPTVPFLLLSGFAAGKGWPQFERWLLAHPTLGPPVRDWRSHGRVPRRAKWLASGMMALSLLLLWLSPAPFWSKAMVSAILVVVACWLWRRPETDSNHPDSAAS